MKTNAKTEKIPESLNDIIIFCFHINYNNNVFLLKLVRKHVYSESNKAWG